MPPENGGVEARYDYLDATKWYMIFKIYYIIWGIHNI